MRRPVVLSTKILAADSLQLLQQWGMKVIAEDFIAIENTAPLFAKHLINQINDNAVIFTSSNAVLAVKDQLAAYPMNVYCMEGKTKQAVETYLPLAKICATASEATGIAATIISKGITEAIFFCGNIRREALPDLLSASEVKLKEIVVYHTAETPVAIGSHYDAVLFFSPSAVRSFFTKNSLLPNVLCFSIGHTTAAEIKNFTANEILITEKPSEQMLVHKVIEHYTINIQS